MPALPSDPPSSESGTPAVPRAEPPSPFEHLGGEARVHALAERFYEIMAVEEPTLARLHPVDEDGRISPENRERFAQFLVGWLGGPQRYIEQHGHPRLRMRHGGVAVTPAMRDAWVRCMARAMDELRIEGNVRAFLDQRFAEVADFLINRAPPSARSGRG